MKYKELIMVYGMVLVIVFIMVVSILLMWKPITHQYMLDYKNAEEIPFMGGEYHGIVIPNDTQVYFVSDVESLYPGLDDVFYPPRTVIGRYNQETKSIYVLDSLSKHQKILALKHEVAHHYYAKMEEEDKEQIGMFYNRFCHNKNEFFAYTVSDGMENLANMEMLYEQMG